MNILALEPYYGGSHQAFLDGWQAHSRHHWTCLTLPPHHWKWRLRHGAITLAAKVGQLKDRKFDLVFASSMLNLACSRGLVPFDIATLPHIVYFHENQLTYPDRFRGERDYHFAFDNFQSMLAADAIWFNSAWHRDSFLSACRELLARMPDFRLFDHIPQVISKSQIRPPGLALNSVSRRPNLDHPHIVWAARWEHDKNPGDFFAALRILRQKQLPFRLSVLGEAFQNAPADFETARIEFQHQIERWGGFPSHNDYLQFLQTTDIFVSTALHEFFGIAAAESILSGNIPVLPNRLAYPELIAATDDDCALLYSGSPESLAERLAKLITDHNFASSAKRLAEKAQGYLERLTWETLAPTYDDALEHAASRR